MSHEGYEKALQKIKDAKRKNSTELDLSDLGLTELPPKLFELANLQNLILDNNQIDVIPDSLARLANLQILQLDSNKIVTIPDSLDGLANLRSLYLSNNQIAAIPDSLDELAKLRSLYLANNRIATITDSLGNLANLVEIYLANNQIAAIPDSLGSLINLRSLDFEKNRITEIPDSLSSLANLQTLDLTKNQITFIPNSLGRLANLQKLYLHDNPDLGLPSELLGPTWHEVTLENKVPTDPSDIIEYAKRINANGHALNEAKLILVGKGAVGKSSLVEKLKYGTFEPGMAKTEGINIERWELPIKGENILLNVWDFGGQEIMHATHQFFLTERSLYLLVLNGREGTEDLEAEYWLKLIESFGGNSPVILVLNKIKEHAFDLNRSSLLEKYPNIKAFVRTDCTDDVSIAELKATIEKETDALDELRVKFPGEWFSIKDYLATTDRNYLRFEEYRKLCADNGVTDLRHQEMLAKYLNQLGIVLNYRDDPRLKDTHVLNPHWVTRGIYKVLNSPLLEENKGEINLKDIANILQEPEYPAFICRFIFDLMKKFYLCFTFPDDDQHYLIPELLPKNQPDEAREFVAEQCLNFQYHYRILPEGLLPRFITRTHFLSESEAQFRWRSGVILKFENCRALVKADIAEKKIFISVMGDNGESRRRLLAVARSDMERIHNEIKNLNPIEMVPLPDAPEVMVSYKDLEVMEKSGTTEIPQVVRGEVKTYKVKDLLHGVDLPKYSAPAKVEKVSHDQAAGQEVDVFISYSHKDESFKNDLKTQLKILQRQNLVRTWNDEDIRPGEEFDSAIDERLNKAEIILLLISHDYIASRYCYEIEMPRALERAQANESVVIPIIIRDCEWLDTPLKDIKALPKDGQPVTFWEDKDSAWKNVYLGLKEAAKKWRDEHSLGDRESE